MFRFSNLETQATQETSHLVYKRSADEDSLPLVEFSCGSEGGSGKIQLGQGFGRIELSLSDSEPDAVCVLFQDKQWSITLESYLKESFSFVQCSGSSSVLGLGTDAKEKELYLVKNVLTGDSLAFNANEKPKMMRLWRTTADEGVLGQGCDLLAWDKESQSEFGKLGKVDVIFEVLAKHRGEHNYKGRIHRHLNGDVHVFIGQVEVRLRKSWTEVLLHSHQALRPWCALRAYNGAYKQIELYNAQMKLCGNILSDWDNPAGAIVRSSLDGTIAKFA